MENAQETAAGAMTPRQVVEAFLKDWETGFKPAFERWFHPDGVWQNTGFPDRVGKPAVLALLDEYLATFNMEFGRAEMTSIACDGRKVLTERIDHLWSADGRKHSAKIMGTFEVKDGLIARYSDYLDPTPFREAYKH